MTHGTLEGGMQASARNGVWSRAMAVALVGSAAVCITLASRVRVSPPPGFAPGMQPPEDVVVVEMDCTPVGVELTKAQIARTERRAAVHTGELARYFREHAAKQRKRLKTCGTSEPDDICFDLRRDVWQQETQYGIRAEDARSYLQACERGDYGRERFR